MGGNRGRTPLRRQNLGFFQSCNCTSHQKPVQTDEVQNKDLQNLDVVDKQQKLTSD